LAWRVHRPTLEAVRRHDPNAAEKAMRKHMEYYSVHMAELETVEP
jgi:DNA-binding GntR family transcriptional regulator